MSKLYDFKKAKMLIDREKDIINQELVSVYMGMQEDWYWTATPVWEQEAGYLIDFDEKNWLAGIDGSAWATPVIEFCYSDDKTKKIDCWIDGEQERDPQILEILGE